MGGNIATQCIGEGMAEDKTLLEKVGEIFGFGFKESPKKKKDKQEIKSFVTPTNDDGAMTVESGGAYGSFLDLNNTTLNEFEQITKYREMALFPEVDSAVDDIVNEAIVMQNNEPPISIDLSMVDGIKERTKKKIEEEFNYICKILNFNDKAYDIFRRWYIDGRIYYHIVINESEYSDASGDIIKKSQGIKELRYIDPRQIKKVRLIEKIKDETGFERVEIVDEFYIYNPRGLQAEIPTYLYTPQAQTLQGIRLRPESVLYVHSGILDPFYTSVISHLYKAIKPLNQLKMVEDALIIYRIARAPERRIFFIDVGNLPPHKAQEYINRQMDKYRNKIVYDVQSGEMKNDRRHLNMLEDFWIPRREGSVGSSVETLPGGENLGEITDVEFFQEKLYKALNVPPSRLQPDTGFVLGRSTEITRDEVKFTKFIHRLRIKFSELFDELLRRQLILKGIIEEDDWHDIREKLFYNFTDDNHFTELKKLEILENRLNVLGQADVYVGKYFSEAWIKENILKQSKEEQENMFKEIEDEGSDDDYEEERQAMLGIDPTMQQNGNAFEQEPPNPFAQNQSIFNDVEREDDSEEDNTEE